MDQKKQGGYSVEQVMVGLFARRGADGGFLPAVPIYRDGDGRAVTKARDKLAFDLGVSLASDYERYVKACEAAGRVAD